MATGAIQSALQHRLNAVHVYCRLRAVLPDATARYFARIWEQSAGYRLLYPRLATNNAFAR
ncbi:MAG: hypothetical protein ACLQVJ_00065 [Syntrophobacteraceae bacterium]